MRCALFLLLLLFSIGSVFGQSSGDTSKLLGDAFKSTLKRSEIVPEQDRKVLFAYASGVMKNLVTFRDDGTAFTVYRLANTEQHIEWRGLRYRYIREELVTDTDRANGITRKYSIGLASDGHRTWNSTTRQWSEWRADGFVMFPSALHLQEQEGRISLANTFHGTFGRGPGTATAVLPPPKKTSASFSPARKPPVVGQQTSPPARESPVISVLSRKTTPVAPSPPATKETPTFLFEAIRGVIALLFVGVVAIIGIVACRSVSLSLNKGQLGERRVANTLSTLDASLYQIHHDIYIPRHDGTGLTQIDHIVVSPYGIFVIETKNYSGWIFGSEKQKQWTQQFFRKKFRFQNPLHQNRLHLSSLASHLALPQHRFHSLVVFAGNATFKTPMPPNVISNDLIPWIMARDTLSLTPPELAAVRYQLADLERRTDKPAAEKSHLASLHLRHS